METQMTTQHIPPNLEPDSRLPLAERMLHPLAATGGLIMPDRLYSAGEVAAILGVAQSTLRRWRAEGAAAAPRVTRLGRNAPPRYRGVHIIEALNAACQA